MQSNCHNCKSEVLSDCAEWPTFYCECGHYWSEYTEQSKVNRIAKYLEGLR